MTAWNPFLIFGCRPLQLFGHHILFVVLLVTLRKNQRSIGHDHFLLARELLANYKMFSNNVIDPRLAEVPRKVGVGFDLLFVYSFLFFLSEASLRLTERLHWSHAVDKLCLRDLRIAVKVNPPNNGHQVEGVSNEPVLPQEVLEVGGVDVAVVPVVY